MRIPLLSSLSGRSWRPLLLCAFALFALSACEQPEEEPKSDKTEKTDDSVTPPSPTPMPTPGNDSVPPKPPTPAPDSVPPKPPTPNPEPPKKPELSNDPAYRDWPEKPRLDPTQAHITLRTNKTVGEELRLFILAPRAIWDKVWVDLNNNAEMDEGEQFRNFSNITYQAFKLQGSIVTIYGDITELICYSQQITHMDVTHAPHLRSLVCYSNALEKLDLSSSPALQTLNCSNNRIGQLNFSVARALRELYVSSNQLTGLDITMLPELKTLIAYDNQLGRLDVTKNTHLSKLHIHRNRFSAGELSWICASLNGAGGAELYLYDEAVDAIPEISEQLRIAQYRGWHIYYFPKGQPDNPTEINAIEWRPRTERVAR